ncbi:two-component system response regulator YesN [Paenibacillus endophyticus]|uniref:Two-component system response regulator YesN n=1 Tax=Paenibacillus endophyticus TaxID=1294268 RepID=A0A7W5G8L8_9BACL|nr:response regulator [Paenibacillus endophyticus]MBB3150805.1 two-component system response regulator YesN [Paenibacillus endophyticus]
MYKVLLADDERLDLEGMRTFIPWQDLGMEVVAGVMNGFDACKVLDTEKVDIIVTDVRMPNMTGLELARRALERSKDIKIIFVSGYQDFSYVKQALSLNAVNYVLKPMDDQELIDSLLKVRGDLDEERQRQDAYWQMVPIVKNEYLLQLLEGTSSQKTIEVLSQEYEMDRFHFPGIAAVLEIDDRSWKPNEENQTETDEMQQVVALCRELGVRQICKINKTRIALLIEHSEGESIPEQVVHQVKRKLAFSITAGVGDSCGTIGELSQSYKQAVEALDLKMFYGKGRVIGHGEVRPSEKEDVKHLDAKLEALFGAMSSYELVRIHDELDELFQVAKSLKSKLTLRNYALYIVMKLDNYLQRTNENVYQLLGLELNNYDIMMQFETINDIHLWLRRRVYEISETLQMNKQKKNWKLIKQIIDFMKERTHDNITLRDLAEQFSLSPNYLGLIFKEETGKNFSEYFIQLRMEKACELLKSTNLKIYEIADRVGYRHLPYFSRQFKEMYGMTPLEYRRT